MSDRTNEALLTRHDPVPVVKINPEGSSPFILIGDHAGNIIPSRLGSLGLSAADLQRHIAWDIGVGALGTRLAAALDCVFVKQAYSRLVIDCNRALSASDCIAEISDGLPIPGNQELSAAARDARIVQIYDAYHGEIATELRRRDILGVETIMVSLHSFTPAMNGYDRPWHVGVLYDGGRTAYATAVLDVLKAGPYVVGDNEPYRMDDTDFTIPHHAYAAERNYVELEVRQDTLGSDTQCAAWVAALADVLEKARSRRASIPSTRASDRH